MPSRHVFSVCLSPSLIFSSWTMYTQLREGNTRRIRKPCLTCVSLLRSPNMLALCAMTLASISMMQDAAAFVAYSPHMSLVSSPINLNQGIRSSGLLREHIHPFRHVSRDHRPLCGVRSLTASSASDRSEDKKSGNGFTKLKEESVRLASKLIANLATIIRWGGLHGIHETWWWGDYSPFSRRAYLQA